jgi:hypothetical protein
MDWIKAHRKGLLAVITAVLVLFVDPETADQIIGAVGVLLTIVVPNDQGAIDRIYHSG